ncbi:Ovate protein family, C-terminal [Sesbania bispinosa]|nr:Ovate protein family, C-terminal [Sesbania bispinosa]
MHSNASSSCLLDWASTLSLSVVSLFHFQVPSLLFHYHSLLPFYRLSFSVCVIVILDIFIAYTRTRFNAKCLNKVMSVDTNLLPKARRRANFRLCNVSSYTSEILEIQADAPRLHVLFVPGNPGVILFYKDFVEFLYEQLGGTASVTAIGHVSHSRKNWENGRLFSLQEQIDHKIDFIREELQNIEIPILLVGHSIGSYISIETFKKSLEKVKYCIGLYPFLTLNPDSVTQLVIGKIAKSEIIAAALSYLIASLGLLPVQALRFIVRKSLGKSWSTNAVEAACSHLSQYHTMRNVLYMAMTEFAKFSETPDWTFIRERKTQFAFLFGVDDHWGPLQLLEEISKQVPGGKGLETELETYMKAPKTVGGFGRAGREGVAVEKDSDDPYLDFRHSMLQMILENEIYSKDDLRELLNCFLQLNSPYHHGVIVRAFTEIWNGVFSVRSNSPKLQIPRKPQEDCEDLEDLIVMLRGLDFQPELQNVQVAIRFSIWDPILKGGQLNEFTASCVIVKRTEQELGLATSYPHGTLYVINYRLPLKQNTDLTSYPNIFFYNVHISYIY